MRAVTIQRREEIRRILTGLAPCSRRLVIDAFAAFAHAAGEVPDDAWKLGWTP